MTLDISGDWIVFDNLETVSYLVRTSVSAFAAPVSVPNVLRQPLSKENLSNPALLGKVATTFNLWAANLTGGIVPKVGDVILDAAAVRWSVATAGLESLQTRWELTCTKERS